MNHETIAAISTGLAPAGISVIRVSGPESIRIVDGIFRGKKRLTEIKSQTAHYGDILRHPVSQTDGAPQGDAAVIDEALVLVMRAPNSYTGEDVVEIQSHGGVFVTEKILETVILAGARIAEPGEFTKRAFLNGKMDLSRAESVMAIISAKNDFALKAGVSGLKGKIRETVLALRQELLDEVSRIEASLDDPEHYDLEGYGWELLEIIDDAAGKMRDLLRRSEEGSVLREGIPTAIAGRPNAGKSSLFNLLSGFEKSIVTGIPGTTRDVLEETVRLGQLTLLLKDTAGLRESDDLVEQIGVGRAKEALSSAELLFYLVDAREGKTAEDLETLSGLPKEKTILIYTKADLLTEEEKKSPEFSDGILFSSVTEEGLEALKTAVFGLFREGMLSFTEEALLTEKRQIELLKEALERLSGAKDAVTAGLSEEFWSEELKGAYIALGKIIGEEVGDDVVDRIFEKFCMGK